MSLTIFRNALEVLGDEMISLGGGEPTIHPNFWQMLGESLAFANHVWLATNGSITQTSIALAKMAKRGIIGCALSLDEYHARIDEAVISAFTKDKKKRAGYIGPQDNDSREVRDVSSKVIAAGRAADADFASETGCVCNDLFVMPNGNVYACGCAGSPCFGNVNDSEINFPEDWEIGECYKPERNECK